jgi:senataxin
MVGYRYFGAFPDSLLDRFYKTFDEELVKFIVETCENNELIYDKSLTKSKTLANIPLPVFYLMLSNMTILHHPKVLGLLRHHVPATRVMSWPTDAPSAGLFLLLMEQTPALRAWATLQIDACTKRPMAVDHFTTLHAEILRLATETITTSPSNSPYFSNDLSDLWQGFGAILRFVPAEWMYPSKASRMDIRQFVISHLSDMGKRK